MKSLIITLIFCLTYINCMAQENIKTEIVHTSKSQIINDKQSNSTQDNNAAQNEQAKPIKPNIIQEIWQGSIYSSTYKAGVCIDANGKIEGVLKLRISNGKVDTYHFYGHIKDGQIFAKHGSGHIFDGVFIDDNNISGKVTLKKGYKAKLEGKRIKNVQLTDSCAPL